MILIVTHLPRCCFGFFQKPEQTDLLSPEAENSKKEIAAITEGPKAGEGDVKIDTTPTKKSESKQTTTIQKPPAVVSQMQGDFITPVTSGSRQSVTALTSPPPDLPRMQPPLIECDPFENLDEFDQFETKEFIPMEIPLGGYEFSICPDYPIIDTLSVPSFTPGTIETAEFQPGMPLGMFDYSYCPDNQSLSSVHYLSQLVMDAELDAAKKIIAEKKLKSAEKKLKIQTSSDTIDVPIEIPAIPGPSTRNVSILESPKDPLKRKALPSTLEEDFDELDIPSKPKEPNIKEERKASAEGDTTDTKALKGTGVAARATAEDGGAKDLVEVREDRVGGVTASEAIIEASVESKEAKTIDDEKPGDEPLSDTNAEPGTLYLTPEPESTTGLVAKVPYSPSSPVASDKTAVPVASLSTEPKESGQMRTEDISGTAVPVTTTSTDQPPIIYSKRSGEIIRTVVPIPTVSTDQAPSEAKKRGEMKTGETSETAGPGPIVSSDQTPIEPKVSGEIKPEDVVTASTDEALKKLNESEENMTDEPPAGSAADERTELDPPTKESSAPDVTLVAAISANLAQPEPKLSGDIKPEDTAPAEEKPAKDEPATVDIPPEQDLPLATGTSEKLSEPASAEVPTASMEQIPPYKK